MINIYAIGTSHKHSPLHIREKLAMGEEELQGAMLDLQQAIQGEAVIVSTCNRTEIYIAPGNSNFSPDDVRNWLRQRKGVDIADEHLFTLHAHNAAQHLFEVASGIDSQVIGDIQIIGQVRDSFLAAQSAGTSGKLLSRLFSIALRTGKRVKTETDLFLGAVSVSYVAVELAKKIFYPLHNKRTLVVGAGDTGELTAQSLKGQGVTDITITNRTEERGRALIEKLGFGAWMPMAEMPAKLHEFDIVIVSTGAQEYIITYKAVQAATERRNGETQLIVDLSVPRNVDPAVSAIPSVFCKDINDLNSVIETNVERRQAEIPAAEAIIAQELAEFAAWCSLLPVTPVIAELKRQSEGIIRQLLEENRHRFSEKDFANVEKLVGSVVKKIIGLPMAHLLDAEADREHTLAKAEYVKLLFNLAPEQGEPQQEDEAPPTQANSMPTEATTTTDIQRNA